MTDARTDVEQLNAALTRLGERAAADPAYRDELKDNQVEELRAAGVSALALSGAFAEEGAEEEEVSAYALSMGPSGGSIMVSNTCLGTCQKATIAVCCTRSYAGPAGAGSAGSIGVG
ncbi:MAG: hypothetical protein LC808_26235 [Actinobacteria bacterium]|nr:hypothetical protein [Actinomycetota bacterium]